ncbi:MAG: dynamin family protein [Campylobacterota bacterium]|nr:dynamin family protein [Campylobacterota bacterium]
MNLKDKAKKVKIVEENNIYLAEANKGLELCSNIISIGTVDFKNGLDVIDNILSKFIEISQSDSNTTGVETYTQLLALKDDIINILNFPKLENHYTVAVGGGFSSGKSTFFNKILGLKDVLPTDTNPTTSISSYITKGVKDKFLALNNYNNIISLDKEAIQAISHAFKKQYDVSFSHILKLISIEQKDLKYDNLVFLDTPGYSKSDSMDKDNNTDENIARDHLRTTDFLIWLVDCQTPISSTDMQFIKTLDLKHPILVVLNKADKKLEKDVKALVEKTKENLIKKKIPFVDVIGYSSSKDIEYSPSKDVIQTYLKTISSKSIGTKILNRATDIFNKYINYYDSQLFEYRTTRGVLNEMIMKDAINEEYLDEITTLSSKRIKQIKHIENSKKSVLELRTNLDNIITKLLKENNINVKEFKSEFVFDKIIYDDIKTTKTSAETFRFPANIQIKDTSDLLKFKDLNSIEAKVHKISSIGVFIKISGINGDLMISKSKILKISGLSNIDEIFQLDDKVIVHITDNKKCVVIKG